MKALHIVLWLVQVALAAMFFMAGFMKLTTPLAELAPQMPWTTALPPWLVRFIGASELAGSIGVVLPAATRIRPGLTPLAGLGLVTIMLLAMVFHATRGEWGAWPTNIGLGALAAFVAWGRSKKVPITPRA